MRSERWPRRHRRCFRQRGSEGAPQIKQLEAKLALHSIYFRQLSPPRRNPREGCCQPGSDTGRAGERLQAVSEYRPDAHLILEATPTFAGKDYNVKLSERRVERTRSYLVEKGVPADHLETRAFGFEKNMTSEEVKKLLEDDADLTAAEKQKLLKTC